MMLHGTMDDIISIQAARESKNKLVSLGYKIEWKEYLMQHSVCKEEINDISVWLHKLIS